MPNQPVLESDLVLVRHVRKGSNVDEYCSLASLRSRMNLNPRVAPSCINRVKVEQLVDFTGLSVTFKLAMTVPAGSLIQYVGAQINTTVVSSGTTACIGLGQHGSTVSKYGFTANLLAATAVSKMFNNVVLAADEPIEVCANVSGGGTIGGAAITAGKVYVIVVYDSPMAF